MSENTVAENGLKKKLEEYCNNRDLCGFEAYVVVKNEPKLRTITLSDALPGKGNNVSFKKSIRNMLLDLLYEKYLSPDMEFISASKVADNQHKTYIIPQDADAYMPFGFLESTPIAFQEDDLEEATGLVFEFRKGDTSLWVYQHLWAILVPNKKKNHRIARICNFESGIEFHEQTERLLTIGRKIDIVVIDGKVLTDNIGLMQKFFGFFDYIRATSEKAIANISRNGIVKNTGKLNDYINRGKNKYAKKLMRIADSKVLCLKPQELIQKIETVDRWKGVFTLNPERDAIVLDTYVQVENLIDLLDERYTKSEITDTEYDTDVKQVASPVTEIH